MFIVEIFEKQQGEKHILYITTLECIFFPLSFFFRWVRITLHVFFSLFSPKLWMVFHVIKYFKFWLMIAAYIFHM